MTTEITKNINLQKALIDRLQKIKKSNDKNKEIRIANNTYLLSLLKSRYDTLISNLDNIDMADQKRNY